MRILVTGGAGFIGSHLVDALMNERFQVRVVDNMSNGSIENSRRWLDNPSFELVQGDLKNKGVACKSVEDIDALFHLAADPDVRVGESDPSLHFNENLLVTFNLLEAMRKNKTAKRIIFASSSTVYGEATVFPTAEDYGPLLPISTYGASKLGCESLISSYCHTFDLKGILLRFANIVGSRATHGVVVDFIRKLKDNPLELEILGDGKQKKSYLHVKDLVGAFFAVFNDIDTNKYIEVYNVGSRDQVEVKRIAEIVSEEMRIARPKFVFRKASEDGRGWKGDVKAMQLSIGKIMGLGWQPSLCSEEAIRMCCSELQECG